MIAPAHLQYVDMALLELLFWPINRLLKVTTFQCHIFTVFKTNTLASETPGPAEKLKSGQANILECECRLPENCHVITKAGLL